ncbi:MAG TPA: hypothetical protein VFH15_00245, partial [Pyrinomonadaceae bacterium]|nr:hypothetical protein [Pyrinomonadaceae bacterium]
MDLKVPATASSGAMHQIEKAGVKWLRLFFLLNLDGGLAGYHAQSGMRACPPLYAEGVILLFIRRLPRYKWSMPDNSASSVVLWSWLFPLTYIIHIGEEFYGGEGYPAYLKRLRGVDMSPTKFLVGQ